jgi:hypothetical protein
MGNSGKGVTKRGKGKKKAILTPEGMREAAAARLLVLLENCTDTKEARHLAAQIIRLTTKPRPKGTQPDSQKGICDAHAEEVLQDRRDARVPFAYSRPIPEPSAPDVPSASSAGDGGDTSGAISILDASQPVVDVPSGTQPHLDVPSAAALRQAASDRPNQDEMYQYTAPCLRHTPTPPAPRVCDTPKCCLRQLSPPSFPRAHQYPTPLYGYMTSRRRQRTGEFLCPSQSLSLSSPCRLNFWRKVS